MEDIKETTAKLMRKMGERVQPALPQKPYVPAFIVPTMRQEDQQVLEVYMNTKKMPAFVMAVEQNFYQRCRNCGDMGKLWVRMCEFGPFHSPPSSLATWFDGDNRFGKGWYIFKKTMFFDCPMCEVTR